MRFALMLFVAALGLVSCSPNNVTTDDSLKTYFDEQKTEGCFALFNDGNGQFTVYNLVRYRDSAFLPAQTFDIITSLVGLQTGVISSDTMRLTRDSASTSNPTMAEAFKTDYTPYFQQVAQRLGKDTLQRWLDSLAYGSKAIKTDLSNFWLDNSLKLTPDEQLGVVKRLYFNQFPFFNNNQLAVKAAMTVEDKPTHILSYKTGIGQKADGTPLAWIAGWVEENRHPYFFVLNMETKDRTVNLSTASTTALRKILTQLNFFKGQR